MFFLHANKENCKALKTISRHYEEASGQAITTEKSAITFSRKIPSELKAMMKAELQIHKEGGVGKYLGLLEKFARRNRDLFSSIIDKIQQKSSKLVC